MYQASTAFHAAALSGATEKQILIRFGDIFFTGDDVSGVEITYPLNEETDVTVGKCVSAELKMTVLNYHGQLSGFPFGACSVSMGVMVASDSWSRPVCQSAVVAQYGTSGAAVITAHGTAPYIRVDGVEAVAQPEFSPSCLVLVGSTLYAGDGSRLWAATVSGGNLTAKEVSSPFLAHKLSRWSGRGLSYQDGVGYEFTAERVDRYEYVPLGTFHIDTPAQRRVSTIECVARDAMQHFDVDADDWWSGLPWPLTRGQLLASLCRFAGVMLKTTSFPGSGVVIEAAPMAGNGLVAKDVLGWIAETACAYARISRDNRLELVWFAAQDVTLTREQHFGDAPAEYVTPAVDTLHVMAASADLGVVLPEGGTGNAYQVLDNPLLYGGTEAEIRTRAQSLYERLAAFPAYTPNAVDAVGDWSIEPGDIIRVVGGDGVTRALPVFRLALQWAGGWVRASYECTGGTGRKPAPQSKRREFAAYRAYHKLETDIGGIRSEIGNVKGSVATLEVTASELRTQIAGKLDGAEAQSMINQTVDKITLEVSSVGSGSSFVLKRDGVEISSDTVDLHVKSVNVDGTITADAINLDTAQITGTLSASNIDASNLSVTNAMIDYLYANKIVGGLNTQGGYVAAGAISDATHRLSELNVGELTVNSVGCGTTIRVGGVGNSVTLGGYKVTLDNGGETIEKAWKDILSGTGTYTAVFG